MTDMLSDEKVEQMKKGAAELARIVLDKIRAEEWEHNITANVLLDILGWLLRDVQDKDLVVEQFTSALSDKIDFYRAAKEAKVLP